MSQYLAIFQLSRRMRLVVLSNDVLQHRIRSYICRVTDGGGNNCSLEKRLSSIDAWTNAWKQSVWPMSDKLSLAHPGSKFNSFGSILVEIKASQTIVLHRLPSRARGHIKTQTWEFEFPFSPIQVYVDLDQDLLVAVEHVYVYTGHRAP